MSTPNVYNHALKVAQNGAAWIQESAKGASASVGEMASKVRETVAPFFATIARALGDFIAAAGVKLDAFAAHVRSIACQTVQSFKALPVEAKVGLGLVGVALIAAAYFAAKKHTAPA